MKKTVLLPLLLTTLVFSGCNRPGPSSTTTMPVGASPITSSALSIPVNSPSPIGTTPSPEASVTVVQYKCPAGKTALEGLRVVHSAEVTESSFGELVTSIDGEAQGGGKYWTYTIDKKFASTSADKYQCKGTEIIQWDLK
jgi:hypothetical protein